MTATWQGPAAPAPMAFGWAGKARLVLRGIPMIALLGVGLVLTLILRVVEKPFCEPHRPLTPHITVFVCRCALLILGIRLEIQGLPIRGRGAVVANHSSWLDIFVLNAHERIYFVSKAEVAEWPGIGALARATGTVFIERSRLAAGGQAALFQERLAAGHRLLFFPEGTSSDNAQVLRFKSSLFAAFFSDSLRPVLSVQPVSVSYAPPPGCPHAFFAWWGDMAFGPHVIQVLSAPSGGKVSLVYHHAFSVSAFLDRKALADACEKAVRAGHRVPA
ncbi:MAG: lysophospholipid acyltransferase family protein [Pseudomonadota bacterium]